MPAPLRAYNPESYASYDDPDLNLTLAEAFRLRVLPLIDIVEPDPDRWKRKNLGHYRTALKRFAELLGEVPLGAIDERLLARWRSLMQQQTPPLSPATIRKHYRYLHATLERLCRLQLIDRVPEIKLARHTPRPDAQAVILPAQWDALCRGCNAWLLSTDSRLPGPLVGRGVLIAFWSTGLRPSDLWPLTWSDLHLAPHCPVPRYAQLASPHGWLYREAQKTGKPTLIPITAALRNWIDYAAAMLGRRRRGQLLPVGNPSTRSADDKRRQFQRQQVHLAAGLDPPWRFVDFRDAACAAWDAAWPEAGGWLLGHAQNYSVTSRHYRTGAEILARAVGQLETPQTFFDLVGRKDPDGSSGEGAHLQAARRIRAAARRREEGAG